jgi:peptidyl-prolyl cis-trans isomerase D
MFNLFRSRQKAIRYLLGAMLMIVALSMITYLIPGYGSSTSRTSDGDSTLFQIGGDTVTAQDIQKKVDTYVRSNRVPADAITAYLPQMIDQIILERATVYEFQRMGLTVTDDEVLIGMISQFGQFFTNGQLSSKDQFEAALAQQGLTLQGAIEEMRYQLFVKKITNTLMATVVVTPKEADSESARQNEKVKLAYIAFPAAKFRNGVNPAAEEIRAYFNSHRPNYSIPEKRAFQALVVDQDKIEQSMTVTDAQLRAAYSASMDSFRLPERVRVRHILLKTTGKSDAEKKPLEAKAQDLLKQLKKGSDFADLAKKNSEDAADKGGELGWIDRGQTVPEFEKAAFSLKPGELSGVVTTQYGYHILQVEEKSAARVKPFAEAKADLELQLKKEGVSDKMQATAEQMHAALEKSPGSAAEVAKQFNVTLVTVPKAGAGEAIPTLGVSPEIDTALASLKTNEVSGVLVLPSNRLAVVVLTDRTPARAAEFNEVESQVRDAVISDKSTLVSLDRAKEAAEKLKAGADIKQLAKSMSLEATESSEVGRNDSVEGLGSAMQIEDVFSKPVGGVIGPVSIQGRQVVAKVTARIQPDPVKMAAERERTVEQIKIRKSRQEVALIMDSIRSKLEADGMLKIHRDVEKRVLASFQQK